MKQYEITVHEFGERNPDIVVMFHPLGVWWDVFDSVIPILERRFHLVVPAVPGLDPDRPGQAFTSIEEAGSETAKISSSMGWSVIGASIGYTTSSRRRSPACRSVT